MSNREIEAVWGPEPLRDGEYPAGARVGFDGVTRIERRDEDLGEYGIVWLDVFKDGILSASFNALHIAAVHYRQIAEG